MNISASGPAGPRTVAMAVTEIKVVGRRLTAEPADRRPDRINNHQLPFG
jgi:hypothetical protein